MTKNGKNRQPLVFIETYGCQMNKCDSELVQGLLGEHGYGAADSIESADIVLVNTCSVRNHAEKRALGRISSLASWKRARPDRKLGIIGCMAQRLGPELLEMKPFLDLVAGPDNYRDLPGLLASADAACSAELDHRELYDRIPARRQASFQAWVTIIRGCNNFCSYCIVPHTRGRERSRSLGSILEEIRGLAGRGVIEITLLGQNVNSYRSGDVRFPDLLQRAADIPGIERVRFMTSHPKDLSRELLEVIAAHPAVCEHIHLPLQAGSDRILAAMNRRYTQAHYLGLVETIRETIPDVALTTDVIVGFPGESETDFRETVGMVERIRFDDAFTYYFSPRSGTSAAGMPGQVDDAVKLERLNRLIALQRRISREKHADLVGRTLDVIPERDSKHSSREWMGRSRGNHVVIFPKSGFSAGETVAVRIEDGTGTSLRGVPVLESVAVT
ncbi:tRNA (N6-isopentenyl adenosine(37)-C2)-methylthiotransferase MiaB [bacterium]|nr:tRNA (N6-isopentenyl adenosine(37)-C2)-methylthiotransferase MiaB [bacterium]